MFLKSERVKSVCENENENEQCFRSSFVLRNFCGDRCACVCVACVCVCVCDCSATAKERCGRKEERGERERSSDSFVFVSPSRPSFPRRLQNSVSEREQRWGSKTVEGSGRVAVEGG